MSQYEQNDPNSIVDVMKAKGLDSSFEARKALAHKFGMTNYKGTAEENVKLLELMKKPTVVGFWEELKLEFKKLFGPK
jgi:hypothetical protein